MKHFQKSTQLSCSSCRKLLGFVHDNIYVAQFLYCEECVGAQILHPDHDFLQNWDEDIFLEPLADFTLKGSDGGTVKAHKVVLAGKCKVFKTMLRAGMSETISNEVKITDMTAEELRPLVNFLYTGRVNQRSLECHGIALYKASHKYDLSILTAICEHFLVRNAILDIPGVFELAVNYGVEKFQEAVLPFVFSEAFIINNSPPLVLKTVREASKFKCFFDYRMENLKNVGTVMELALHRIADYLDNSQNEAGKQNKIEINLHNHYKEITPSKPTSGWKGIFGLTIAAIFISCSVDGLVRAHSSWNKVCTTIAKKRLQAS